MTQELHCHGDRSDKFYGELVALVEDIPANDPEKLLRCKVRVLALHANIPKKDLPWAEFKLPIGCRVNDGSFLPPKLGDYVWCDAPYGGDPRRLRITGSSHYCPGKVPNLPHETFAGASAYTHKRTGEEPDQPAHVYGEDTVFTQNGFMICINKDGSANFVQKGTGSEFTITKDGHGIIHIEGNLYRSASGDSLENIGGDEKTLIMGKQEVKAMGTIDHDGGTGSLKGEVNGNCLCCYSGKPHPHVSASVRSSK